MVSVIRKLIFYFQKKREERMKERKRLEELNEKKKKYELEDERWEHLAIHISSPEFALDYFKRLFIRIKSEKQDGDRWLSNHKVREGDIFAFYKKKAGLDNIAIYIVKDKMRDTGSDRDWWDDGYNYCLQLVTITEAEKIKGLKEYILSLEGDIKKPKKRRKDI